MSTYHLPCLRTYAHTHAHTQEINIDLNALLPQDWTGEEKTSGAKGKGVELLQYLFTSFLTRPKAAIIDHVRDKENGIHAPGVLP